MPIQSVDPTKTVASGVADYAELTHVPPMLKKIGGKFYVCVIRSDGTEIRAPIGRWFIAQAIDLMVMPLLRD